MTVPPHAAPLLSATGIVVRFGGHTAVSEVDLRVDAGSVVGLIGPNGAGKTTTFNALTGLISPDAGRVKLDGRDITSWNTAKRARFGLARTFQRLEVFTSLTVRENVETAIEIRRRWKFFDVADRWNRRTLREESDELLDKVGLADLADVAGGSLSTGQARLVEVARALAIRPKLLLLDEPASGQDVAETVRFGQLLRSLAVDGMGILMVEHDMDLVMQNCDHIYVLDFGSLIADGTPAVVRKNPAVLAAYLGAPES